MDLALDDDLPVVRDALHQQVAQRLRKLLVEGTLPAGAKLNERVLCEQLGISRGQLREAIDLQAAEGLMTLEPERAAFSPRLTREEVLNTFDASAELEGLAGERAAARVTDTALSELQALQYDMQAAFERRDLQAYYAANAQVHDWLSRLADNPVLRQTWQQLNRRLHALRFRSNQDEVKWAHALDEHAQMLRALKARDGQAMRRLLVEHLRRKRDAVLEQIAG